MFRPHCSTSKLPYELTWPSFLVLGPLSSIPPRLSSFFPRSTPFFSFRFLFTYVPSSLFHSPSLSSCLSFHLPPLLHSPSLLFTPLLCSEMLSAAISSEWVLPTSSPLSSASVSCHILFFLLFNPAAPLHPHSLPLLFILPPSLLLLLSQLCMSACIKII